MPSQKNYIMHNTMHLPAMTKTLHKIYLYCTEIIFPSSKLVQYTHQCTVHELQEKIQITSPPSLFLYKNPYIKTLVGLIKYKKDVIALDIASTFLADWIIQHTNKHTPYLIVAIPQSKQRNRERGYNQSELLCATTYKKLSHNFSHCKNALIKTKHTTSQVKNTRIERIQNIHNTMEINHGALEAIKGTHVIIIDDVHTTGATAQEALRVLRPHAKSTLFIAFAGGQ